MPIPFDRFRFLNETGRPRKLTNYGMGPAEYSFDEKPVEVLPRGEEREIPPTVQEVGIRRQNEEDDPIEVVVTFTL